MVKKISYYFIVCVIILLPSCWRIPMHQEFARLKDQAEKRTGENIQVKSAPTLEVEQDGIEVEAQSGISRAEANYFALKNNPGLQASFQDIGVAKADLVQSGFLTNPELSLVSILLPGVDISDEEIGGVTSKNSFNTAALFRLDDFWKKPFQTQVACFQLKAVMAQVEEEVLKIKRDVELAYNFAIFRLAEYQVSTEFVADLEKLYKVMKEHNGGEEAEHKVKDIDIYTVESILGSETNRKIKAFNGISFAFSQLRNVTGMWVSPEEFTLTERLFDYKPVLPDLLELIPNSIETNPRVLRASADFFVAQKSVSLERASIIQEVSGGFVTDTQSGVSNFGPNFFIMVPLFDANQAQIARAKYLLDKTEKILFDTRRDVTDDIIKAYYTLKAELENLLIYETILQPAFDKGIDYIFQNTEKYVSDDNLNLIVLVTTLNLFFDTKLDYLQAQLSTLDAFAELEFVIGRRLLYYGGGLKKYEIAMEY